MLLGLERLESRPGTDDMPAGARETLGPIALQTGGNEHLLARRMGESRTTAQSRLEPHGR